MTKTRKDSKHLIYEIENTLTGASYIGVTSLSQFYHTKSVRYAANRRFQKHMSRAKCESKDWALYKDMKKYGPDVYDVYVKDVLRGKAEAHKLETFYLQNFVYELNSTHK